MLNITFDCKKVTMQTISNAPGLLLEGSFNEIEKIKSDNNIERINGVSYPVIFKITNSFPYDVIFDFKVTALLKDYGGDTYDLELGQNVHVPTNQELEFTMFDNSGFLESILRLDSISFQSGEPDIKDDYFIDHYFLINMDEMTNSYYGFRSKNELEEYFLLFNYLHNGGIYARGMLLKLMFDDLKRSRPNSILTIDGHENKLTGNDANYLRSMIQVDIISKIMIYVEDLIIIIDSMMEPNKNYYHLLDEHDPDVGTRVTTFLDNLSKLSDDEMRTILCYTYPDNSAFDSNETELVNRIIQENIQQFKQNLELLSRFRNAHTQMFRRYKHAGLPIVFGVPLQPPLSDKFEFCTVVSVDRDPLRDIFPVPYFDDVAQRYKELIKILEELITIVIKNRLESIKRKTTGIIPDAPNHLSSTEKNIFSGLVAKFSRNNPLRCRNCDFHFVAHNVGEKMKWYLDLGAERV